MSIRTVTLASLLLSCPLGLGCHVHISDGYTFNYRGETAQRSSSGIINDGVTTIVVTNKFGDVDVAHTSESGSWSWNGQCWAASQSEAEDLVSQLEMVSSQDGEKQTWSVVLPEQRQKLRGVKSNLVIRVPAATSVVINNEHGAVVTRGLAGSTTIRNQHGAVDVSALEGLIEIRNEHGSIAADGLSGEARLDCEHGNTKVVASSGLLNLSSKHGNVDIEGSSSDVTLASQHGKASIETSGANLSCESEHCDVTIRSNNEAFETIVAEAAHSDIRLLLQPSTRPWLDLDVEHGKISSDFESSEVEGSPHVRLKTEHGDIVVRSVQ